MSDLTRLDIETKVALMAALVYDGDVELAVGTTREIEREAHRQVTESVHKVRKSLECGAISLDKV